MPNLFKQFVALLPERDQRNIGEVTAVNATANTTTLSTFGGGSLVVVGTGVAIGDKAFFKGGLLEGTAPNLPIYEIDV